MYNLRFIHVNKCGGNSIHMNLNHFYLAVRRYKRFNYKQVHDNGRNPIGIHNIEEDAKVFIFVRDPVERFISAYNYTKHKTKYDIEEAIEKLINGEIKYHHMSSSIFTYISPETIEEFHELGVWFFVGVTENIKDDYSSLKGKICKDLDLDEKTFKPFPHLNKTGRIGEKLDKKYVYLLKEYFKNDYKCLDTFCNLGYLSEEYIKSINKSEYIY